MEAEIGIFGGSGLYSLFEDAEHVGSKTIKTPYGKPSGAVTFGEVAGKKVAFMPRHGQKHDYPPHKIPFRANLHAFKELGVKRVIAPCAAGSLQPNIKPGDFVICDQFIDRTNGREDTFFEESDVVHISPANPYCPEMRRVAIDSCNKLKIPFYGKGTCVIINGPRFSTKAESQWFHKNGWEVINMTQYPEVVLAREAEMCYLNVSLITDWDAGLEGHPEVRPVTADEVGEIFADNIGKVKKLIYGIIEELPEPKCGCGNALEGARL